MDTKYYKAAVIGCPISHSLSPHIFRFLAQIHKINLQYNAYEVMPEQLCQQINKFLDDKNFLGMNVTLPLKVEVIKYLKEVSNEAKKVGAVNVVHHLGNKLIGYNTDVVGIEKTLKEKKFNPSGKTCLIFGAGGAAKAVGYVLANSGAEKLYIYNRTNQHLDIVLLLKEHFPKVQFFAISDILRFSEIIQKSEIIFDLVVNATSVGMIGNSDENNFFQPLKLLKYNTRSLAFDLIYNPENTVFLKIAQEHGLDVVGGLPMLIHQALATFKIWFDINAESSFNQLYFFLSTVLNLKQKDKNIYFVGFMGVGKSTLGKKIAEILDKKFIDSDHHIEEESQMTITEIFARYGEAYFRTLEKKFIVQCTQRKKCIVALGGGAFLDPQIERLLLETGIVVYLYSDISVLTERLKMDKEQSCEPMKRPLLNNLSDVEMYEKIVTKIQERTPSYEKAHLKVDVSQSDIWENVYAVINMLGKN